MAASLHLEAILGRRMGSSGPLFGLQTKWRAIRLHSLALSIITEFSGVSGTAVALSLMHPSQHLFVLGGGGRLEVRQFCRVCCRRVGLWVVFPHRGVVGVLWGSTDHSSSYLLLSQILLQRIGRTLLGQLMI